MQKPLQFKISSALKNIIGSDLISDDFIAVFELVKNSYDAYAERVDITFENIYSSNSKIIIRDNGIGMNYNDLINKWLFVAYSAKKEGTEEESYSSNFRDRIKVRRAYAGAKGIGRFSCDRLGHELYLETIKEETNPKVESLLTEWDKFDGDLQDEFVNVSVLHETKSQDSYNLTHGTVLEISGLKSSWDRKKLLDLKSALAKLINPNTQNTEDEFKIFIHADEEIENDKLESDNRNKVNAELENLIFETLDLKTTKIVSKVFSENEAKIETSLFEGGRLVYTIIEENKLAHIHDIELVVYYLNRSAKATFSRRMGLQPIMYGHIFVYKNGIRVYPYGERGEDPLKMDNRKSQGYNRYFGTRELLGYISINEPNEDLTETSSRGDGLIKTKAYVDLVEWFYTTLRRLEKYGIDIIDWGRELSHDDFINLEDKQKQAQLRELISNLTKSENIISFHVSPEIFEILDRKQEKSAKYTLVELTQKLEGDDFNKEDVVRSIKRVEHEIDRLKTIKEEAEDEAFEKLIENEELAKELDDEIAQSLFRESIIGTEKEDLISLQHQIVHTAGNVTFYLDELIKSINHGKPKEVLITNIHEISFEVQKIVSASRYVTKAGFNKDAEKIKGDIVQFINEYVEKVYVPANSFIHKERPISIKINNEEGVKKGMKFRPFEITVILDNLFKNSRKARSKLITLNWTKTRVGLVLSFKDNGVGIPNEIMDKIFDFGFSTTDGSGIGLFTVRTLLNKYNGTITVNRNEISGAELLITIPT